MSEVTAFIVAFGASFLLLGVVLLTALGTWESREWKRVVKRFDEVVKKYKEEVLGENK